MAERMFGTNGIRGIVNKEFTVDQALQLGKVIATTFKGTIAISTDTRESANMIKKAFVSGITSVGYNVMDLGVLPTSALQYYVRITPEVMVGIMVTASHNTSEYIGIKCISDDGTEMSPVDELRVEDHYAEDVPCVAWNKVGLIKYPDMVLDKYIDAVVNVVDVDLIKKSNMKVCIDCSNGAGYHAVPLMLRRLGVSFVSMNCDPVNKVIGFFNSLEGPELRNLMALVRDSNSSLGAMFDSDADRCSFVSNDGALIDGDHILAVMAKYVLTKNKGNVVIPVSTSDTVTNAVKSGGGTLLYTPVGSPVIARKMRDVSAVFGGEGNGVMLFPEFQYSRDGLLPLAMMLECVAKEGPLHKQVTELNRYHMVRKAIPCADELKDEVVDMLEELNIDAKVDTTDGKKYIFNDGWILIRPSGTENVIRINSESKEFRIAEERAEYFVKIVSDFINS